MSDAAMAPLSDGGCDPFYGASAPTPAVIKHSRNTRASSVVDAPDKPRRATLPHAQKPSNQRRDRRRW